MSVKSVAATGTLTSPLRELPSELLVCIVAEIETAQTLSYLSFTCKSLHAFVEKHGYRTFVQSRFPSINLPTLPEARVDDHVRTTRYSPQFWKDAAHGLTTLSRNLDRRAFVAQDIRDSEARLNANARDGFPRRGWHGPSMGFVPVIDSYEAWYGGHWASRKEVVAWGAGAKLVVRLRDLGAGREEDEHDGLTCKPRKPRRQIYVKEGVSEGVDDITTLNLLPRDLDNKEEMLVGRASGGLERVIVDGKEEQWTLATYDTHSMPVRYANIHRRDKSVAAVCLGDHAVALYSLNSEGEDIGSLLDTSISKVGGFVRTWSATFLREGRLAVGLGRSDQPINIFDLGQGSHTAKRAIQTSFAGSTKLSLSDGTAAISPSTSVYSIAHLPQSSVSSGAEGDVFLSGAYDGHVRLHDLRLAHTVVSLYSDPVDVNSAVYSLLPIGQERFVAGSAQHSLLKVFDLRMPGQRLYHAADALHCSWETGQPSYKPKPMPGQRGYSHAWRPPQARQPSLDGRKPSQATSKCSFSERCTFHASVRNTRNWNVYLGANSYQSSVYTLSRPSSVSPVIYAGIQNHIMQIDVVSVLDQHPDPVYNLEPPRPTSSHTRRSPETWSASTATRSSHAAQAREMNEWTKRWDPEQRTLNLSMYEQSHIVSALMNQRPVRETKYEAQRKAVHNGLDERWTGGWGR